MAKKTIDEENPIIIPDDGEEKTDTYEKTQVLTSEEKALKDRVARVDDDWQTITEESMVDFSLSEDPYKLPPEAKAKQDAKEFAFRWAVKSASRVDELKSQDPPAKWWVCNATSTPFLAKHCDPVHGGVQKHDQILFFKPYWMHRKHQDMKNEVAARQDAAGRISSRDGMEHAAGTWHAGEQYKISSRDQVYNEETGSWGADE